MPPLVHLVVLTLALLPNHIVTSAINPSCRLEVRSPIRTKHHVVNVDKSSSSLLELRGGSSVDSATANTVGTIKVIRPCPNERTSAYVFIGSILTGMLIREVEFAMAKGNKAADLAIRVYRNLHPYLFALVISSICDWGRFNHFKRMMPSTKFYRDMMIGHFAGKAIGVKWDRIPISKLGEKELHNLMRRSKDLEEVEELCLFVGGLVGPVLILYLMREDVRDLAMSLAHVYFGFKIILGSL